jgi:hypothetical protein
MIDPSGKAGTLRIDLDLHELRSEAEENAGIHKYAGLASKLPDEIRRSLSSSPELNDFEVRAQPAKEFEGAKAPSKSWYQVIDGVMILIAPIGVAGLAKLIVRIVEVTRPKFPSEFELKGKDGVIVKLSKGKITLGDIREVERLLRESGKDRIVLKAKRAKTAK